MSNCRCGRPSVIKQSGECRRCYNRRYYRERVQPRTAELLATARCAQCEREPVAVASSMLCASCALQGRRRRRSTVISYNAAHQRVRADRGAASIWRCIKCGEPADNWAYRGGSPRELRGTVTTGGRQRFMRWSPDPSDFDPLCLTHHAELDGRVFRNGYRHDPSNAKQRRWTHESYLRQVATPEGREAYRARKRAERARRQARGEAAS